jgi:hypothetical protein
MKEKKMKKKGKLCVDFILKEDLEKKLFKLFKEGFIIVQGDNEAIMRLEEEVYTPNTEKNTDFIAFLLPLFPPNPLYLVKKTIDLKKFLTVFNSKIQIDFEKLIALNLFMVRGNKGIAEALFLSEENCEKDIQLIIKKIKSKITGLEVI